MTRGQFIAVTTVLAAAVMAGAGYLAYSAAAGPSKANPPGTVDTVRTQGAGAQLGTPGPSGAASTPAQTFSTPSGATTGVVAGPPECRNADVTVSLGQSDGGTGHISVLLLFTNDSQRLCYLHGYPGAELVDPSGVLPSLNAVRRLTGFMGGAVGMAKAPVVPVAVGQTVSAVLEWTDVTSSTSSASCYTGADELQVTPPNSTLTTTLALGSSAEVCGGFQVHPVLPVVGNVPTP
jgi:hypothetical protein